MPKGYLYADIVVTNPAEYENYRQLVPATIAKYGGVYRVRGGDPWANLRHSVVTGESDSTTFTERVCGPGAASTRTRRVSSMRR